MLTRRSSGQTNAGNCSEQTRSAAVLRSLQIFRKFDYNGCGFLCPAVAKEALEAEGVMLAESDFQKLVLEVRGIAEAPPADPDAPPAEEQSPDQAVDAKEEAQSIDFLEFVELSKRHLANHTKAKTKLGKIPRAYLGAALWGQYVSTFREFADASGQLERSALQDVLSKCVVEVTQERLQSILSEVVDDDKASSLGETEFLLILVKALNLKKRKVGPKECDMKELREEGWTVIELKRAGYDYKDFIESGYKLEDIMCVFTPSDFSKAGVSLSEMVAAGWDCYRGKEYGHSIADMVQAGCTLQRLRDAGYTDLDAAAALKSLGIPPATLRAARWKLSELRRVGFSVTELRQAGFSSSAVNAVQQLAASMAPDKENLDILRQGTQ